MGQANHEPSMEDILASIKRIIAEDTEAAGARQPRMRREAMNAVAASPLVDHSLETEQEQDPPSNQEPEPDQAPSVEEAPHAELAHEDVPGNEATPPTEDVLELTSPMPETAAASAESSSSSSSAGLDGLLSNSAAIASRSAFAALTQLQVRTEEGHSNTLEGLVSDLLRPMLREFLDRELPGIVERLVAAEIQRVSGRS